MQIFSISVLVVFLFPATNCCICCLQTKDYINIHLLAQTKQNKTKKKTIPIIPLEIMSTTDNVYGGIRHDQSSKGLKYSHKRRSQNIENLQDETAVKLSSLTWDVFSPPPKDSIRGKLVPATLSRYQTRRKVSIEVHRLENLSERLANEGDGNGEANFYQECVVR